MTRRIAMIAVLAFARFSSAETLDVCPRGCTFATIQDAINAAVDGDEVVVASGTYLEVLDLLGKAITVRGAPPPGETIIVTPLDFGSVVRCVNGEGSDTRLIDLTITGGSGEPVATWSIMVGGGLLCWQSSPTLIDCRFVANTANTGAGVFSLGGTPSFTNCTFEDNHAPDGFGGGLFSQEGTMSLVGCTFTGNTGGVGGGAYSRAPSGDAYEIRDCLFEDNHAVNEAYGFGGGFNHAGGQLNAVDCVFIGNTASGGGGGLSEFATNGLVIRGCSFESNQASFGGGGIDTSGIGGCTVVSSRFEDNQAGTYGGGILASSPQLRLISCRLTGNSAGTWGGAVLALYGSQSPALFANCLVAGNATPSQAAVSLHSTEATFINTAIIDNDGLGMYVEGFDGQQVEVHNAVVWGNTAGSLEVAGGIALDVRFSDVAGGWKGPSNIDADPRITVDGDAVSIAGDSPCIDVGDTSLLPADAWDLDGDGDTGEPLPIDLLGAARVAGEAVEMGPIEYHGPSCPADVTGDDTVDVNDILAVIAAWGPCGRDCPADVDGNDTVGVDDILAVIAGWGPCDG